MTNMESSMANECIRILRIVSVMNRGGIETQIMNIYRKIDRSKIQFDFLVTRNEVGIFDKEIEKLGGIIYHIEGIRKIGLFRFIREINYFFKKHREYKIVHSHMNTWSGLFLTIAKKNNIPVRIAQSHSAQNGIKAKGLKKIIEINFKRTMRLFIKNSATHFWAVGNDAGEWLFGKKIARKKMKIIPNAKELEIFKYNIYNRKIKRKEFNIEDDDIVIGHVGSFTHVKNHNFIIDLFSILVKKNIKYQLCLVGEGPRLNKVKEQVSIKGIDKNVMFLGLRDDVHKLMSAFDVLLLPSIFEGMPNVIIEAQASGLPSVVSKNVTNEIDMGFGLVNFCSIENPLKDWIDIIEKQLQKERNIDLSGIMNKGYDLNSLTNWIENFYCTVL